MVKVIMVSKGGAMAEPDPKINIHLPRTGQSCQVDHDDTLVDATFRYELPIRYRCERAVCTTCLIEVLKGQENLSEPSDRETQTLKRAQAKGNYRLACQCSVTGDVEIDYIPLQDPRRRVQKEIH
jgi:ferredoxin